MDKKAINKIIDQLILNEDLMSDSNCDLLDVKVSVTKLKDEIERMQITNLYMDYLENISGWLRMPQEVIQEKINKNEFTDVEHSLIITNILLMHKNNMDIMSM